MAVGKDTKTDGRETSSSMMPDSRRSQTSTGLNAEENLFGLPPGPSGHATSLNPAHIFDVKGLVAVITGGGTGIGLMMAKALEENGAVVYIVGRRSDVLEKAAKEYAKFGNIFPLHGDITNRESLLSLAETVKARHGFIDLLVNNAAIVRDIYPVPLPSPADDGNSPGATVSIKAFKDALWNCGSPDDFGDTFASNTTVPYYTTLAFLELLHEGNSRRRKRELSHPEGLNHVRAGFKVPRPYLTSQVLTVSSAGSEQTDTTVPSLSYALSKSAVTHLGKLMANLLEPWAIRSNIFAPGVHPSAFLMANTPVGRGGTNEDIAGVILFLASRAGAFVNGVEILVDGGLRTQFPFLPGRRELQRLAGSDN